MNRRAFLKRIGIGAGAIGALVPVSCDPPTREPNPVWVDADPEPYWDWVDGDWRLVHPRRLA